MGGRHTIFLCGSQDMGYSYRGVVAGCAVSQYAMDGIALLEQKFTQIRPILASDSWLSSV